MASKNGVKEMRLCNRSAEWLIKHAGSDEIAASIVSCCGVDVDIVDSASPFRCF
jgi:predicted flavoprotein YhiN